MKELTLSDINDFSEKNIKIWWMNVGAEDLWRDKGTYFPNFKSNDYIANSIEQLCLLLADENDIVILRDMPSDIIFQNLFNLGKKTPQIRIVKNSNKSESISKLIIQDKDIINEIIELKLNCKDFNVVLIPYAVTKYEEEISRITNCELFGANYNTTSYVNSKINSRLIAESLDLPVSEGVICSDIEELENYYDKFNGSQKIVIKDEYNASGKGLYLINNKKELQSFVNFIKRKLDTKSVNFLVEKWYKKQYDINYQIVISKTGDIFYIPPKRQVLNNNIYIGSQLYNRDSDLNKSQRNLYKNYAKIIGEKLKELDYKGVASIDSIITLEGEIIPVLEINGRFSLSTYISLLPFLLGEDKLIFSCYYNIKYDITLEYIWDFMSEINYTKEKGKGIVIYSYMRGRNDINLGRIFALIISDSFEEQEYYRNIFENIINIK
ncbi:hypothetical protein CIW83_05485 [Tissierella sp. P1]|uniref:ATP-grasp domain-containing protein n=1 Tax=Tissierella sp. P1 TaxID=1280483 RepID=UPI000BA0250C|nr:ATP-grasp domain-containing protein [Tissierella sp. P1]OZV12999.1 hypothetical protein CIW83_05485 [Tissierella sp. P1]